jgi:hypothetical protein
MESSDINVIRDAKGKLERASHSLQKSFISRVPNNMLNHNHSNKRILPAQLRKALRAVKRYMMQIMKW